MSSDQMGRFMEESLRSLKLADAVADANELRLGLEVAHEAGVALFLLVSHGFNTHANVGQEFPRLGVEICTLITLKNGNVDLIKRPALGLAHVEDRSHSEEDSLFFLAGFFLDLLGHGHQD